MAGAVERIAQWVAELTFDSGGLAQGAAGARGAAQGMRQLLYTTSGIQLDIAYPTEAGARAVRGQVVASGDDAIRQRLAFRPLTLTATAGERPLYLTSTDEDGGFMFDRVEPGSYELSLELETANVIARVAFD